MLVKTKAIVISVVKYQEKSLVVKCFTASDGMKSYFVRNAFSGKKADQKIAYFQPFSLLELEADHKNKGTLEHFKEIKIAFPYQTLHVDLYKSAMVLFLSEIVHHSIREEEKNGPLFSFLEAALIQLDTQPHWPNFHLKLLIELSKHLGFYPEQVTDYPFFDLSDGLFTTNQGLLSLSEHETFLFKKLLKLEWNNFEKVFTNSERRLLLTVVLNYFSIHLHGFKKPKSLEVLTALFT